MKRLLLSIFLSAALCTLHAQHYVGLSADMGVAWQLDNLNNTSAQVGGAFSLGAVYQWRHHNFLLQTGIGISPAWLGQALDSCHMAAPMHDTEGMPYTYRGYLEDRRDWISAVDIAIPLLGGVQIQQFYALAGVRVHVPVLGKTRQQASLTTVGDYGDRYYGVLHDMPQHGFYTDRAITSKGDITLNPDLRVCAEIGFTSKIPYWVSRDNVSTLQVGAFAEYGVLNSISPAHRNNALTEVIYSPQMDVKMNHVYTHMEPQDLRVNNLRVGVRITFLFSIAKAGCNCSNY